VGDRLRGEADPEEQAAGDEDRAPGDAPRDEAVGRLDQPRADGADRGQERNGLDADVELGDDEEEDRRQDDRLGVIDRVGCGQEPQSSLRPDVDGRRR
jgi:hypothetical protein